MVHYIEMMDFITIQYFDLKIFDMSEQLLHMDVGWPHDELEFYKTHTILFYIINVEQKIQNMPFKMESCVPVTHVVPAWIFNRFL